MSTSSTGGTGGSGFVDLLAKAKQEAESSYSSLETSLKTMDATDPGDVLEVQMGMAQFTSSVSVVTNSFKALAQSLESIANNIK